MSFCDAIGDLGVLHPRLTDAGEIALDVRGEDRDANTAERLCHYLQCYRLTGAGRSSNQTVTIGHGRQQVERVLALGNQQRFGHIRGFYMDGVRPQIASARELWLTGALKSSPPPELILEEHNSGDGEGWLRHPGYTQR